MLHLSLWLSFLMNRRLKQHIRGRATPVAPPPPPPPLRDCYHSRMGLVQAVLVQCCFRLKRPYGPLETGSPGRPSRLSHCSWAAQHVHQRLFIARKIFGSTLSCNVHRAQWSPGYRKLACPSLPPSLLPCPSPCAYRKQNVPTDSLTPESEDEHYHCRECNHYSRLSFCSVLPRSTHSCQNLTPPPLLPPPPPLSRA